MPAGATAVTVLGRGITWFDLEHLGHPHVIAAAVVSDNGSVAVVDPGPTTCLDALERGLERQGLRLSDVTHLLLTHIHLDHAGAAGTIVRRNPQVKVCVHEVGAPHLADPTRLVASATRLYGDAMGRLWGEIAPVPDANLVVLKGSERLEVGGRAFEVAHTPGHASHHVAYFDRSSGVAFCGDAAGVRVGGGYVFPPTNPPEVDLESWRDSINRIEAWGPDTLFVTHFGPASDVQPHLRAFVENLEDVAARVRQILAQPGSDEEKRQRFSDQMADELRRQMTESQLAAYSRAEPLDMAWSGLVRYWRKREVA